MVRPGSGVDLGVDVAVVSRLIPVRIGESEVEVEAVVVAGTELTAGRMARAAESAVDAFTRAQDAIVQVARSTAEMIEKVGPAARPDHVEVEFGLKFSASGGVIMAGVAGEATLKVTLNYEMSGKPAALLSQGTPDADAVQPESGNGSS